MEDNKTTVTFSFSDLFHILKKKWKLSITFGLITLVLSTLFLFIVSNNKSTYTSTFQTSWKGIGNDQYSNGESFNYTDLISKENLTNIKNSNDNFKDIDIDAMIDDKDIKITSNIYNKIKDDKNSGYVYEYEIIVKQKYFKNDKIASEFIQQVAETNTINKNKKIIDDYKLLNYFAFQRDTTEYPEMINNIREQTNLQINTINQLISQTSSTYVYDKETNQTLGQLLNEIEVFLKYGDYSRFETKIRNEKLVRNIETYKDEFLIRRAAIDLALEKNQKKIESLKSIPNKDGQDSVPKLIAELTLQNVELQYEREYIEKCLNEANDDPKLNKDIEDYQKKVASYNDKIELAYRNVNYPKSILLYKNNRIIVSDGMGLLKTIIFSVILTIVIEFILSLILVSKYKKEIND